MLFHRIFSYAEEKTTGFFCCKIGKAKAVGTGEVQDSALLHLQGCIKEGISYHQIFAITKKCPKCQTEDNGLQSAEEIKGQV